MKIISIKDLNLDPIPYTAPVISNEEYRILKMLNVNSGYISRGMAEAIINLTKRNK